MRSKVIRFPAKQLRQLSEEQMMESLRRLSMHIDSFAAQAEDFARKAAAMEQAYKKASDMMR